MSPTPQKRLIGSRAVGTRYGITQRTVDRWVKAQVLPPPDRKIRNRRYWDEAGLDRHDRRAVAEGVK